jgi:hypothetical protein
LVPRIHRFARRTQCSSPFARLPDTRP